MTDISKKYQKLTQLEHILKRPGMYIGGIEPIQKDMWVIDNNKIVEKSITYSPGLFKLFDELIVNAYDQSIRDDTMKTIKVDIDKETNEISVYNDGKGIEVVIHPKEKIYVPELIFGHLMTSSSFDEDASKITGGIHGLGAKLTAIFSKTFKVEVADVVNKKLFIQTYSDNLSIKSKPKITNYNKNTGYVKLTYTPDLKYFGLDTLSDDIISLMERRVYDMVAVINTDRKINIYLNDDKLDIKNINDYVALYTDSPQVSEYCDVENPGFKKNRWKIVVTKSNGNFNQMSFVNGINTTNGGHHVNYILNSIIKSFKNYISTKQKYKNIKIKDQFIKDYLWLFLVAVIENPTFSSQSKDELVTPSNKFGSVCEISENMAKKIYQKLDFEQTLDQHIKLLQQMDMSKISVTKKSTIKGIPKLYDANYAGTNKAIQCSLILTEGDSAKTMAISGLSVIPKATNYYGVFPLKGKLLNVREATHNKIVNNEEFKNLKNIIGLKTEKVYTKENITELRYGNIILMMDADVDGSHIKGLFINMIDYYWPSLLKIDGFIKIFITPIVKASNRNQTISFYKLDDYNKWKTKDITARVKTKKDNNIDENIGPDNIDELNITENKVNTKKGWTIKYYKGLGTNTSEETKKYFSDLDHHIIELYWTQNTDEAIKLAFSGIQADDRKNWLKFYNPNITLDYTDKNISYYDFIHKELIHFSNYNNIRSIPNIMDGMKPSQRKVLYTAFKIDLKQNIKVIQFVGEILKYTSYHHGDTSLINTIIAMAHNFVGSNNINLLAPNGQFGTRILGGKDSASARYIHTQLEKISRLIFRKEDDELLEYLDDDGLLIEPKYYVPIIPMILVNGASGIGTGYSTYIPKYNVFDIIDNLVRKINGGKFKPIEPYYNNFKGTIVEADSMLSGSEDTDTYYSKGTYIRNKNTIQITELPIGTWTETYKDYLDDLMEENKFIKSVGNNSTDTTIDFMIKFVDSEKLDEMEGKMNKNQISNELEKFLSLVTNINLSDMHAYTPDIAIKRYNSPEHIMEEYYSVRYDFYFKRKDLLLKKVEAEIELIASKVKFIDLVVHEKIKLFNIPRDDITKILKKHKLLLLPDEQPYDYLIKMSFVSLTEEKIRELKTLYNNKKKLYNEIKNKTIEQMWLDDLDELEKSLRQ